MSKVTIGIPVFNGGEHLRLSIESVLHQTFTDFELIVTDDGSIDGSMEVVRSFADPRIVIVDDGENRGLPSRINQQVRLASGQIFIRMDADDVMFPNRVEKQVEFLENHKGIDVIGAKSVIIDGNNRILYQSKQGGRAPISKQDVMGGNIFIHPTVAGWTEWFRNNPYDESKHRSQDFFLWLESVENSNFAIIDEPLLFYRVLGTDVLKKFVQDNHIMRTFYLNDFKNNQSYTSLFNWSKQLFRLPIFYSYYLIFGAKGVMKRRYQEISPEKLEYYENILRKLTNNPTH